MKKDMRRETTANNSTHISTGSTWMTNEYNANVRKTDTGNLDALYVDVEICNDEKVEKTYE